ncbi:MAG: hypothetical protein NC094_02780 [Bacteroidales bacterium]|nr:hypothetical protein [Lachnoclostridium sp.]MCM1383475.1 hypothetical protein [Lachnoclostridium sp.]MCM1464324.1 hypothetical protein [Bacteroidales bacterium]
MSKNMSKKMSRKAAILLLACILLLPMYTMGDHVRADAAFVSDGDAALKENAPASEGDVVVSGGDAALPVVDEWLGEQEYMLYKNQLNAQLCSLQIAYLKKLGVQRKAEWEIEQEKVKLGYAVPVDEMEAEGQYKTVLLEVECVEAQQQFYKEVLELYGREYAEIQVPDKLGELQEDYIAAFLEDSAQKTYDTGQNKEQYEIALKIYVKNLILQYENIRRKVMEADIQIAVLKGKAANAAQLYEAGKITKVQLGESETELKRLEYERISLIYDAQMILYQLDHKVTDI